MISCCNQASSYALAAGTCLDGNVCTVTDLQVETATSVMVLLFILLHDNEQIHRLLCSMPSGQLERHFPAHPREPQISILACLLREWPSKPKHSSSF